MITLLSYNIRFGKNLGKIVGWIKRISPKPDIICFQEFPEARLEELPEMLDGENYSFVFAPSFLKKKRGRFGELTAFCDDNLKLVNSEIVELGENKLDSTIFRYKSRRTSLITQLKHDKKIFTVANVHLTWFALHRGRKKQLEITIGKLKNTAPAIIVGDYNYSLLLGRKKGLVKFMEEFGYSMAGKRVVTHKLWKIPQQIDYAFYKGMKINQLKVGRVKYSDHYPMFINFEL